MPAVKRAARGVGGGRGILRVLGPPGGEGQELLREKNIGIKNYRSA
jgi:hypothetical protein